MATPILKDYALYLSKAKADSLGIADLNTWISENATLIQTIMATQGKSVLGLNLGTPSQVKSEINTVIDAASNASQLRPLVVWSSTSLTVWTSGVKGTPPESVYPFTGVINPPIVQEPGVLKDITSWAQGLTNVLSDLLSPAFWLRVGEVILGLILAGVAVAHLSTSAGEKLRSIPIYGKAIPS